MRDNVSIRTLVVLCAAFFALCIEFTYLWRGFDFIGIFTSSILVALLLASFMSLQQDFSHKPKRRPITHQPLQTGVILIISGMLLWLVPFTLVAIDNAVGATKPADTIIGNFGVLILMLSPLLILAGLLMLTIRFLRRAKR